MYWDISVFSCSYFVKYMYSMKVSSDLVSGGTSVRRVACEGCFGVRNSHGEPTRAAAQGGGRSRPVAGDAAFGPRGRDSQGWPDVAGMVRGSAGRSWTGVLHLCAPGDLAQERVTATDSRGHVVDHARQWVIGADRRFTRNGFSVEALAVEGFARRAGSSCEQPGWWRASIVAGEDKGGRTAATGRGRASAAVSLADCDGGWCTGYLRAVVADRGWMGIVGGCIGVRGGRGQCVAGADFGNRAAATSDVVTIDVSETARSAPGRRLRRIRAADLRHWRGPGRVGLAGWTVGGSDVCQGVVVESGSR